MVFTVLEFNFANEYLIQEFFLNSQKIQKIYFEKYEISMILTFLSNLPPFFSESPKHFAIFPFLREPLPVAVLSLSF